MTSLLFAIDMIGIIIAFSNLKKYQMKLYQYVILSLFWEFTLFALIFWRSHFIKAFPLKDTYENQN